MFVLLLGAVIFILILGVFVYRVSTNDDPPATTTPRGHAPALERQRFDQILALAIDLPALA